MEEFLLRRLDQLLDLIGRALDRISPGSPFFVAPWFGFWAALTTYLAFLALHQRFHSSDDRALSAAAFLGAAGVVAGLLLGGGVRAAVNGERWKLPLLGNGVAFLAVELLMLVIVIGLFLAEPSSASLGILPVALILAPLLSLPLWLLGGTLSGFALWAVSSFLDWRAMSRCNIVAGDE